MWATKWHVKEGISEDIMSFVTNLKQTLPGKCKPLIKTHKAKPYPLRLLLSGTGTPVQPISKLVQIAISHLTGNLPYPVIDTNELLQKVDKINEKYSPLPDVACFAVCGIVSLYPNVNNEMRVPATGKQNKTSKKKKLPKENPNPKLSSRCILEALDIALHGDACQYMDGDGRTLFAKSNHGTAMGPCHACDYVDIFMGEPDREPVPYCSVTLLPSRALPLCKNELMYLDWSRFRDNGITTLPNSEYVSAFEQHLQNLPPPGFKWVVTHGKEAEYLDVK